MTPGEGSSPFHTLGRSAGIPPITWPTQGGLVAIDQPPGFPPFSELRYSSSISKGVSALRNGFTFTLRHTCASELLEEGLTVAEIRDWLGHTFLAATDKYLRKIAPHQLIEKGRQRQW